MAGLRARERQAEREEDLKSQVEEAVEESKKSKEKTKPDLTYEGGGDKMTVRGQSVTSFVPEDQVGKWSGADD